MVAECTKKVFYCGKLPVGDKGDGDSSVDQRPVILSIDWAFHLTHAIGSRAGTARRTNLDMLAVTGTGGTYIYQRVKLDGSTAADDATKKKDLEETWIKVHHDGDLVGNICRFAKTDFSTKCPGTLAVATLPKEGVSAEVHMLTQVKDAVLEDLERGLSLFKTESFFRANFTNPMYEGKIIDLCWGYVANRETMLIFRESCSEIHSLRWVYGSRNNDDSEPGYYWFRENMEFDSVNPVDEDIFGCMSPNHEAFVACTKNSVIKIFRRNGSDGPAGNDHWYGAGRVKEQDFGNVLLSFSPSFGELDTTLAALKQNGDVTVYSFDVPVSVGDAELTALCTLSPMPGLEIPKYLTWTKPTVFWTCGQTLDSLTLISCEVNSEWASCTRIDRENTGIVPFNGVNGLCSNAKKTNTITWIGPNSYVHFACNGRGYLQKVRNLLDEKFSRVPTPPRQLIEFSTQYEETKKLLMDLLAKALSQSDEEHNRLMTVLEALAKVLDEIYRGKGDNLDFQECIEDIYEKGRQPSLNP